MATYKILRRGFVGAVLCVGCLYLIINGIFVSGVTVLNMVSAALTEFACQLATIQYTDVVVFLKGGRSNFAPL
jgi:hypothetical protein